jgi:transposase InsO family protein
LATDSPSVAVRSSCSCRKPGSPAYPDVRAAGGSPTWPRRPTWSNGASGARSPTDSQVTDITEHPTREGKVYCAVVLDVFSRRVVGPSIDASATAALVTNALGMAIEGRRPDGTVIHSDQGAQFTSWAFTQAGARLGSAALDGLGRELLR